MGLGTGRPWPRLGTGETLLLGDSEGCVGFGRAQAFRASSGCPHTDQVCPQMLETQRVLGVLRSSIPRPPSQPLANQAGERQEVECHVTGSKSALLLGE